MSKVRRRPPGSASPRARHTAQTVLAITASTRLNRHAKLPAVGARIRHTKVLPPHVQQDRGLRHHLVQEVPEGRYSGLPVWSSRDQWLAIVMLAATVWFPDKGAGLVRKSTLLAFAAVVAAAADDRTGRHCREWYGAVARKLALSERHLLNCWNVLAEMGLAVRITDPRRLTEQERLDIYRAHKSRQRGYTSEWALVVPREHAVAYAQGCTPQHVLNVDQATAEALVEDPAADGPPVAAEPSKDRVEYSSPAAVDNVVETSPVPSQNVDTFAPPKGSPRSTSSSPFHWASQDPRGSKSTASRAHNRSSGQRCRAGGSRDRAHSGPDCDQKASWQWMGARHDMARALVNLVLWLNGCPAGRISGQLKRFTDPDLPMRWTPHDMLLAMDRINIRLGKYSPSNNLAGAIAAEAKRQRRFGRSVAEHELVDAIEASEAAAGRRATVRSYWGMLKWYLSQLDPINDHPRVDGILFGREQKASCQQRRERVAEQNADLAARGIERGSEGRAELRDRYLPDFRNQVQAIKQRAKETTAAQASHEPAPISELAIRRTGKW